MELIHVLVHLIAEEDDNRNNLRIERRFIRDRENPFEMPNESFRKFFRLSKEMIFYEILQPLYNGQPARQDELPLHLKVLGTINFLATGSDQKAVGNSIFNCMSQSSLSKAINQVCRLITNRLSHVWIKFPRTNEERGRLQEGFYTKWGMRGVIGAIDGTHVEIIAPPITDEEHMPHLYINRKGRHSINVMLICDSNACILGVNARFPGSVHDAAIWHTCSIRRLLRQQFADGVRTSFLIGDSGYGVEPWLFTPVNNAADGTPEAQYNVVLRRSRNVIERTNGLLKAKFRCLSKFRILHYNPTTAAYIIYTSAILYNMSRRENFEEEDEIEEMDNEIANGNNNLNMEVAEQGRQMRHAYIRANF